jgi:AraC-like DNA-binding protein
MKYLASHEDTTRGTSDFPIELYYVDRTHPRYEMPFHWHMECELMRVLCGSFLLTVDSQTRILTQGDTAIISSGAVHGGIPSDCIYECLVFESGRLSQNANALFYNRYRDFFDSDTLIYPFHENGSICSVLIHQIFETMQQKSAGYELASIGLIWQLFGQLLQEHAYTVTNPAIRRNEKSTEQIKSVLNYIRKNFASPLTLSELAAVLNMSPEHFCRLFHSIIGKSPIDYVNYYRIECACELLCTSCKSITEVAYSCGFNDLSYFNRMFKKYKKITPGCYRKTFLIENKNG